jgi:ParB-like chromosome segregation protein Spo0J
MRHEDDVIPFEEREGEGAYDPAREIPGELIEPGRYQDTTVPEQELEHIAEALRPLAMHVDDLLLDPANARKHGDKNLETIASSLSQFGQQRPIVLHLDGKTVIAGNGTLTAARALGWKYIAAMPSTLTGAQAVAFGLADNRSSELAEWDFETLGNLMRGLQEDEIDVTALGWKDYEIEPLLQADWNPPKLKDEEPDADEPKPPTGDKQHGAGDLRSIECTLEQHNLIENAIAKLREVEQDQDIPDGRALELICADYLAGK